MFPTELRPGVTLELLEPRHADEMLPVIDANRAYLRRWLPWLEQARTVEGVMDFIQRTRQQLADDNGFQTAIRAGGAFVGMIGFHGVDKQNRSTSIGYWLAEDAQGRGIITDACRASVSHAFGDLRLHRVEIRCAVENHKSRAIPERLGFQEEGHIREAEWLYDHFVDHVVYGMLAPEWKPDA